MSDYGYINNYHATITIPGMKSDESMLVTSFSGTESLSSPYVFKVEILTTKNNIIPAKVFGHLVTISITARTDSKNYKNYRTGYISHVSMRRLSKPESGYFQYCYELMLVPRLSLLNYHVDSRIFKDRTALQIMESILSGHGFKSGKNHDYDLSQVRGILTKNKYPIYVQYQESDFQFIERLFATHCMFYYFKHSEGNQTLVISDNALQYPKCDMDVPAYLPRGQLDSNTFLAGFYDWNTQFNLSSVSVTSNSYNAMAPSQYLKSRTTPTNSNKQYASSHEKFGYYQSNSYLKTTDFNKENATILQQQQTWHQQEVLTHCTLPMVNVGFCFETNHESFQHYLAEQAHKKFLITKMECHFVLNQSGKSSESINHDGLNNLHQCRFLVEAIPVEAGPPRMNIQKIPPSPILGVIHHAYVVTKTGAIKSDSVNANADKYGMPYIGLHWDQTARTQPNSERYIPVPTIFPRPGGFFDIPHPGETVKVQFTSCCELPTLIGVTGDDNQYKLPLGDSKTQTKIMSRPTSDKVSEVNQILLEDKANGQNLLLDAPTCFNVIAAKSNDGNKFSLAVDKEGNLIITAKSVVIKTSDGEIMLDSSADIKQTATGHVSINANQSINNRANLIELIDNKGFTIKSGAKVKVSAPEAIDLTSAHINAN